MVIIALGFLLYIWKFNDNDTNTVKVGVSLPLSGEAAIYGESMKNSILLAYEDAKNKQNIELFFQDDLGTANGSVNAINNLLLNNVDVIIGASQSKTALPIIKIIDENKIPIISPAASTVELDFSSHYFFRVWASDSYDGGNISNYLIRNFNPNSTKVAVFYTESAYGEGIKSIFEKNITKANFTIVFSEKFEEGISDFRTQINKIKESEANVLFLPGYYAEIKTILKQIKELKLNIQILGTSSFNDEKLLSDPTMKEATNGIIFSYPTFEIDNPNNRKTNDFLIKYKNKYNKNGDVFGANSYDCLMLINKAISLGAKLPNEIKNMFYKIEEFDGAGGKFHFDKNGNVIKSFNTYIIENGKTKKIK